MNPTTWRRLQKRISDLGCEFEDTGFTIWIDAPAGMLFAGPLVHCISLDYKGWKAAELYGALMADLNMGVAPCEDPACDACGRME